MQADLPEAYPSMALSRTGAVATIRFIRPELRNVITSQWLADIGRLVAEIRADSGIRALILTGEGSAFCAGGDLAALSKMSSSADVAAYLESVQSAFASIENLDKPVVASVNGHALGGGCELMMCCDLVVAQKDAKIGLPELLVGTIPGSGGLTRLPRMVGVLRARELVLLGRPISARRAMEIGLISEIADTSSFQERAMELAIELAERPPLAVAMAKQIIARGQDLELEKALKEEAVGAASLWGSHDHEEGLRAFRERRRPVFYGR